MPVVIIESPNKKKKLQNYLGDAFIIVASYGHVRDLPKKEIGVTAPDYQPDYVTTARREHVKHLKTITKKSNDVYLATDPDREGEAIAWHLKELLGLTNPKRVKFNEITKKAVDKAMQNATAIDEQLFQAQQARRVIDRLVGYRVSPVISDLSGHRLSAGRVQSIAVKLIAERHIAIEQFQAIVHFGVELQVDDLSLIWKTGDFTSEENPYVVDRDIAEQVAKTKQVIVIENERKPKYKKAPAPFNYKSLLTEAETRLGLLPEKMEGITQKLFEGDGGESGYITYHRTDSVNLSDDGIKMARDYLKANDHAEDLPEGPNRFKENKNAEIAHEAIRPTDFMQTPPTDKDQAAVYDLIKKRALASQMKPAQYDAQRLEFHSADIIVNNLTPTFAVTQSVLVYEGYKKLYPTTENDDKETNNKPVFKEWPVETCLDVDDATIKEKKTRPPALYTGPKLIDALEKAGVGRPSTYVSIIKTIITKKYVLRKSGKLHISDLGLLVYKLLNDNFEFMDVNYTRQIEEYLDGISQGRGTYLDIVRHCDKVLAKNLGQVEKDAAQLVTLIQCPECEEGHLKRIKSKNGHFWGCSGYKQGCKATYQDINSEPLLHPTTCPQCNEGALMRYKSKEKKSYFWSCNRYKQGCKASYPDRAGKPDLTAKNETPKVSDEHLCPDCGEGLIRRPGRKKESFWWGCSGYPNCSTRFFDEKGIPAPEPITT